LKLYNQATVSRNKLALLPFDKNNIPGTQVALNNEPGSRKPFFKNRTNIQMFGQCLAGFLGNKKAISVFHLIA
jgi:hypothetical protein